MTIPYDRRPRLNTTEVAEMFAITRVTLYRWIKQGKVQEPMRDPVTGWHVWQQAELDALTRAMDLRQKNRRAPKEDKDNE